MPTLADCYAAVVELGATSFQYNADAGRCKYNTDASKCTSESDLNVIVQGTQIYDIADGVSIPCLEPALP